MPFQVLVHRGIPFSELESLQASLASEVGRAQDKAFLVLSEPLPTFTSGISAPTEHLLWSPADCAARGIAIHSVHRGGKWTYHGPGQVVVYPIFALERYFPRTRIRGYLETFRSAILGYLSQHLTPPPMALSQPFGIYTAPQNAAGSPRKTVSFGVGVRRGVTLHGAAVYHSPGAEFAGIIPCGCHTEIGSLQDVHWPFPWEKTAHQLADVVVHSLLEARAKEFSSTEKLVL